MSKKNNKIPMAKRQYGLVKQVVAEGCQKNMSAKEISDETGISMYTIYSVAYRMGMRPRYVYTLKKKYPHGELTRAVVECCKNGMTARQIAEKLGYDTDAIYGIARKAGVKPAKSSNLSLAS